jgi:hypothetical protein
MERRRREQRRILKAAPVDRRSQYTEHAVHRRDGVTRSKCRLEGQDLRRFLQRRHGQVAKRVLHRFQMASDPLGAAKTFGVHVLRLIPIDQIRDSHARRWFGRPRRQSWIFAGHDLRNEFRFPDAFCRLLRRDRFRRPAREREVVDRHAPPLALVHHVEPPGMIAARAGATAFLLADLPYSHRSSF